GKALFSNPPIAFPN
nr:Chain A, GLY-LYS-ALA-LEU-PHE-SER-ASN-PRO-PRO-ILE-ALA-PHE-PRO-ASN [Helianthus annuus]